MMTYLCCNSELKPIRMPPELKCKADNPKCSYGIRLEIDVREEVRTH